MKKPPEIGLEVSKVKGGVELQAYRGYSNSSLQSW